MVRDRKVWEALLIEANELEKRAKQLRESARILRRDDPEQVLVDGHLRRKSVNWRTADSITQILDFGRKFLPREELEKALVDGGHVSGETFQKLEESARLAVTLGLAKGYLFETPEGIGYRTGIRKSKVLKNT